MFYQSKRVFHSGACGFFFFFFFFFIRLLHQALAHATSPKLFGCCVLVVSGTSCTFVFFFYISLDGIWRSFKLDLQPFSCLFLLLFRISFVSWDKSLCLLFFTNLHFVVLSVGLCLKGAEWRFWDWTGPLRSTISVAQVVTLRASQATGSHGSQW